MKKLIDEIVQIYHHETIGPFPYKDFRQLKYDFTEEFRRNASHELITADFNTYMMFIYGLSSGGIVKKLEDPLERYKTMEWLNKSFFEWFPKYKFLEPYDFSEYEQLHKTWKVIEKLRQKLIELIKLKEIEK
ncbi:YxiJ family protein [Paenibacillus sepulcri]|uniref:YxiJ-like family protein n=1 Tax=Paenibacillus sepulcri TaxID=359917 RepID=A0ABS7BXT4_9BACL|nr:YxiJ-like family protein [Paenibacillus sepulcri]